MPPKEVPGKDAAPAPPQARLRPAALIGIFTMLSRVMGLLRDILFAWLFFGRALDAFALAFTIPNLFRRLFGEGALAGALVPAFVAKREEGDPEGAGRLAARALGTVMVLLGAVALAVTALSALAAFVLGGKAALVAGLLAIVMPYVALICGAAVLMAYLNAHGRFGAPAAAPALLNLALIVAALFTRSIWAVSIAVLVGGLAQFAAQYFPARRLGLPRWPSFDLADEELRRVGRAFFPALAGLAAFQVNVLFDRLIAEAMIPGDGAVGTLFLGNRLMQLPLSVFALSIATAALPLMASAFARKDEADFKERLRAAGSDTLFWTVPAAVGLILLAEPISALLFDYGSFARTPEALERTSLVVMLYGPGLLAFGLAALYSRARYARCEADAVMRASLWSVAANLVLNFAFVILFQRVELEPVLGRTVASGEAGLALASSASGLVYLSMLMSRRGALRAAGAFAAGVGSAIAASAAFSGPLAGLWEWAWLAPTLPAEVCVGAFGALAALLATGDRGVRDSFLRVSAASAGMGVFVMLVLSSLPPTGAGWVVPFQRVVAPVALGAVAYWFLVGLVATPEYERARIAVKEFISRRRLNGDRLAPPE